MKALDSYDVLPSGMREYVSNYGFHFSKRACEYAISKMRGKGSERIEMMPKEQLDELMSRYGVEIKNKFGYDYVFVFHMAKADYYKSSIPDEQHMVVFVKDYIDDEDASEETPFRRWLATMVGNGQPIDWEDII